VYRCKDRESGLILAAKVVTTKRKDEKRCVEREIDIMRQLQHPRVIQLFDAIEDVKEFEMCLILEM
jgi:myosin-light-chain kinase